MTSKETVKLISPDLVKAAIKKLKSDKSDVSGAYTSACLKSASAILHDNLAKLFQAFLTQGYICHNLLIFKTARVYPIQRKELLKINILQEISLLRLNQLDVDFDPVSLEEILEYICLK